MANIRNYRHIRGFSRDELTAFLTTNATSLIEEEALAVLENPNVTSAMCQLIARTPHLAAFNSVRLRLVQNRATPLAHPPRAGHESRHAALGRRVAVAVPESPRSACHSRSSRDVHLPSPLHRTARAVRFRAREGTN